MTEKKYMFGFWTIMILIGLGLATADQPSRQLFSELGITQTTTNRVNDTFIFNYDTVDKAYTHYYFNNSDFGGTVETIPAETWTKIYVMDTNKSKNFQHDNGTITFLKTGVYRISYEVSFEGMNGITYRTRLIDSTVLAGSRQLRQIGSSTISVEIDKNTINEIEANETLELQIWHDDNIPEDLNFSAVGISINRVI